MNDLNSVLIEGAVSGGLSVVDEDGVKQASFLLCSQRIKHVGKFSIKQDTYIRNVLCEHALIEGAIRGIHDGRKLRIVGRLVEDECDGGLCVAADHIEYRPEPPGTAVQKGA